MRTRLVMLCSLCALVGQPAAADTPRPFPEFDAKRIKAPPPGSRPRIDVQIDPAPEAAVQAAIPLAPDAPAAGAERYGWFWDKLSVSGEQAGPGRLEPALSAINGASDPVQTPRLGDLQAVVGAHGISILKSTLGTQVSPALVLAVISVESAGRSDAVSRAGATGLMQLMPDTAARFGVVDSTLPDQNIQGGVQYLDWLMGRFGSDPILVLAGYNAGEGAVDIHDGVPPFPETRDYVPKVLAAFQVARGLCLTPPMLLSDGCVFAGMN